MTELGGAPWNLNFCGTQKVGVELRSFFGTRVLNDGTQFVGTQEVCGTEVLNDGTQFVGTQK